MFPTTTTPPGRGLLHRLSFYYSIWFWVSIPKFMRCIPAEQFFILDAFSPVSYFSFWQEFLMCKHSLEDMFTWSVARHYFWKPSSSPLWSGHGVFLGQTSLFKLCPVEFQVVCTVTRGPVCWPFLSSQQVLATPTSTPNYNLIRTLGEELKSSFLSFLIPS